MSTRNRGTQTQLKDGGTVLKLNYFLNAVYSDPAFTSAEDAADPMVINKLDISNAFGSLCARLVLDALSGKAFFICVLSHYHHAIPTEKQAHFTRCALLCRCATEGPTHPCRTNVRTKACEGCGERVQQQFTT